MSDSDKVCKIMNCEHYSDCVCENCDCLEKAYNKGRADGYHKAENDYFENSQKDRTDAYNCGYEVGRADAMAWIPCSERLPENKGDYIVTMKSETITNMYCDTTYFYNHISYHAYRPIEDILAWMPLPEPYKEQIKGEK